MRIASLLICLFISGMLHAQKGNIAFRQQLPDGQPDWLLSRIAMYWQSHATDVYIKGETFDHAGGEKAPAPTVRYTGTRSTFATHGHQQTLVGMSSFEVIHEDILYDIVPLYDFLYEYLNLQYTNKMDIYTEAFKKWADNIIANGVPHNNWNLMQARYMSF